jgi:hypothetical protein
VIDAITDKRYSCFFPFFFCNMFLQNEVRKIVQDEVENLRDDIEEAIRNLHMDMISQFHQQSQELNNVLSAQNATIDRLTDENRRLQEENATQREERSNFRSGSDDHEFAMH